MTPPTDLPRLLGLLDSISIVLGTVIGAGIFPVPGSIARALPSLPLILAAWAAAGILSFLGALAYAELGAMLPESGGQYVYLREAYGPLPAFVCGWSFFVVIHSGSIAAVCVGFAIYLSYLIPDVAGVTHWAPPLLIAVLTAVNYRGASWSASTEQIRRAEDFGHRTPGGSSFLRPRAGGVGLGASRPVDFREERRSGHAGLLRGVRGLARDRFRGWGGAGPEETGRDRPARRTYRRADFGNAGSGAGDMDHPALLR